jgi:mannose-1-phosphate guanylyltransferase
MAETDSPQKHQWCVIVADDHGPEWAPTPGLSLRPTAVQYCSLGESTTLLQKALHRAARVAAPSQVMVTVMDEYRDEWQPSLWFVRPQNRFVGDARSTSALTVAAALLAIAADSPSNIITMMPAKCFVTDESILNAALRHARTILQHFSEGVITLGMVDVPDGIDEDYLIAARATDGVGLVVRAMARRPVSWVARHLRENGAMVASGIFVGYAGAFAAHISKHLPGLTIKLVKTLNSGGASGMECFVTSELHRNVAKSALHSLRWCAPAFPQHVLRVRNCGWSGLRSAAAVARITAIAYASQSSRNPFEARSDHLRDSDQQGKRQPAEEFAAGTHKYRASRQWPPR